MKSFPVPSRNEHVVQLHRTSNGLVEGAIVGRWDQDGQIIPINRIEGVRIENLSMRFARLGSLWAVAVRPASAAGTSRPNERGRYAELGGTSAAITPPTKIRLSAALEEAFAKVPDEHLADFKKWGFREGKRRRNDQRATSSRADEGPAFDDHGLLYVVEGDATRLITCLPLGLNVVDAGRTMTGSGVDLGSECAPDYVAVSEGWLRSAHWPVASERLLAPLAADARVLDLLDPEVPVMALPRIAEIAIMARPPGVKFVRFVDWRSDDQVLDRGEHAVRRLIGATEDADEEQILALLGRSAAPSPRDAFEIERLVEVSRRRGRLPREAAAAVFASSGLNELMDAERAEIRREMIKQASAEVDDERRRLGADLETARRALAETEAKLREINEREEVVRRAETIARDMIGGLIDAKMAEVVAEIQEQVAAGIEAALIERPGDGQSEEVVTLRTDVAALRQALEVKIGVADARSQWEHTFERTAARIVSVLAPNPALRPPKEAAHALVTHMDQAVETLRWHAYGENVGFDCLVLGVSIALAGKFPLFVGSRAYAAARALAAAATGDTHRTLHCDPTLISVQDLLGDKAARTTTVIDTIAEARGDQSRWHGVAFTAMDWSPCGYWIEAMANRRGPDRLADNLLLTGALATDGARIPIPMAAMTTTIPIEATSWTGERPITSRLGPWACDMATLEAPPDAAFTNDVIEALPVLSRSARRDVATMARFARAFGQWDLEATVQRLAGTAEWLSFVVDGSEPTAVVVSLKRHLIHDGQN